MCWRYIGSHDNDIHMTFTVMSVGTFIRRSSPALIMLNLMCEKKNILKNEKSEDLFLVIKIAWATFRGW